MTRYEILDITNYENRINEILAKVENNAKMSEYGQSHAHILVCGDLAIKRYIQDYAPEAHLVETPILPNDGKTVAGFIPYIFVKAGADMGINNGRAQIHPDCYYSTEWLIYWGGEYYRLGRDRKATHDLCLYDDPTDYYNYLPHNWDKENPAPAKIGVITDKKLTAWAEYIKKRQNAANEVKNGRNNEVADFLNRIKNYDYTGADYKISDTRGYILKNGLMFTFQITNTGYIQTELKVYTNIHDSDKLANFELMTSGNYKSKKI